MAETLEIVVSDDGLQAIVKQITPKTAVDDVMAALKEACVSYGISGESIQNSVSTSQKLNRPIGDVVVAEGTPPKAALPPHIEPPEGGPVLSSLGPIVKLLELKTAAEIAETAPALKARSVLPGETLGCLVIEEGEAGMSVTGQKIELAAPESRKSPTEPGRGATKSGIELTASIYGYAGILDGQVSVLPPIWVTEDSMIAAFVYVSPEKESGVPSRAHLDASLKAADVKLGVDEEGLGKLVDALARGTKLKPLIPVARGEHPTESVDAAPEFSFPSLTQSGLVQEDGSIDLRERNSFPGVAEGETLVQGKAGAPGTPGHTVNGETIEIRIPVEAELVAGENVRLEGDSSRGRLVSEMEGGASCATSEVSGESGTKIQHTVSVRPVAQISGDVNYETGNLDFKGNVEIKGSVLGPFIVKASGDIRIGETVESGAQVYGDANLVVQLGIVGENTEVKIGGNITAKFIQDATVSAGGNIATGSYIRSANVSSKGSVTVEGFGGAVGGILGGEVWASEAVISKNVGSEHAHTTTISLGFDRESYTEYKKASRLAAHAHDMRHSLLKSIGIRELKPDEIKKCIRAQPHRRHEILRYVQKANYFAKAEEEHLKQVKDLGSKMKSASSKAHLDVSDTAYPKVTIRIGDTEKTLENGLKGVAFRLDPKEGITAYNLSGEGEAKSIDGETTRDATKSEE